MGLSVAKGTFTARTTTGTTAVTGLGFQPKALLVWTSGQTATGYAAGVNQAFGMTDGTNSRCIAGAADDNVAAENSGRIVNTDLLRVTAGGTPTLDGVMTLSSFDADGFTVNWPSDPAGSAMVIHYLALGGTDITNVYVGQVDTGAGTGNFSTTAPGFQPDLLIGAHVFVSALTTYSGASLNFGLWAASRSPAGQALASVASLDAAADASVYSYQRATEALAGISVSGGSIIFEGTVSSFDANGWTGNVATSPGGAVTLPFMAIKGPRAAVLADTQKASTGTQAKTGIGFQPKGALFFGTQRAASTALDNGSTAGRFFIGASDGTNHGAVAMHETDAAVTMDANRRHVTTVDVVAMTNPSTTDAEASLQSFDADGYTLNWTTADATAREFIAVLFGPAATVVAVVVPSGGATAAGGTNVPTLTVPVTVASATAAGGTNVPTVAVTVTSGGATAAGSANVVIDAAPAVTSGGATAGGGTNVPAVTQIVASGGATAAGGTNTPVVAPTVTAGDGTAGSSATTPNVTVTVTSAAATAQGEAVTPVVAVAPVPNATVSPDLEFYPSDVIDPNGFHALAQASSVTPRVLVLAPSASAVAVGEAVSVIAASAASNTVIVVSASALASSGLVRVLVESTSDYTNSSGNVRNGPLKHPRRGAAR